MKLSRFHRLFDATSQWLNVLLLDGDANESISGRSYRQGWRTAERVVNWCFSWLEADHCRLAYLADVERARVLVKQDAERV